MQEAKELVNAGHFSGAYYLGGYALECALKACIAKSTALYDFPDKQRAFEAYDHSPERLCKAAGLSKQIEIDAKANRTFATYWEVCKAWSEASRYETHSSERAQDLLRALQDTTDGVLPWIRRHW